MPLSSASSLLRELGPPRAARTARKGASSAGALAAETREACSGARSEKLGAHLERGRASERATAEGEGREGAGRGDCLHEFPSGRPASALCPMRSVRGGTRLTFPHHFTVTFGRQAGSHAGVLSPELVDLFGISLPPQISSAVAGLCTDGPAHPPARCTSGCGHPEPSAPDPRLHTEPRSSERHERDPEAPARRAGTAGCSPLSGADPEHLQPFVNWEA